jgi:tetratricopeptide (TPR) repeat protein
LNALRDFSSPPFGAQIASVARLRSRPALLLLFGSALLFASGCVSDPSRARDHPSTAAAPGAADRFGALGGRDRVLFDYRFGAAALRRGDFAEARARFDDAIARIGGIITNDADAARARSLFSAERTKPFIGEPYERVMAYYYRGILYWHDGEADNARACFRSAQVIDSDPDSGRYESDYVLLDYLDGLASMKLHADGTDAFRRAQHLAGDRFALPPYNRDANVLVFAEFGYGPRKYAAGPHGEQLRFLTDDSPSKSARLVLAGGRQIIPLPAYDDLGYQAITRGGRVMDHILGNKAYFKTSANMAGDVAFVGAVVAADEARRRDREGRDDNGAGRAAVGLGILGVAGKIASAATQAEADTRQWDNLPQRLSFAAIQLPPGEHPASLEFLGIDGQVLEQRTQRVILSVTADERDTVVFLSELNR